MKELFSQPDVSAVASVGGSGHKPSSYINSLDGIRAFAVLVVLLSHTGYGDLVPGRAGVTIFFFLSGYLITTLMLSEYEKKGTVEIKKFYGRRFVRLLPPMLILLPSIYIATALGWIPGVANIGTFFGQLFYAANYLEIFVDDLEKPAGTIILWSLAIEEHFYILFPLAMLPLLKRFSPKQIFGVFAVVCAAVLAWRFVLASQPNFDPNRTAFGTDTRADSILFGCMLGLTRLTHTNRAKTDPKFLPLKGLAFFLAGVLLFGYTLTLSDVFDRETFRYTLQGIALFPMLYYPIVYHQNLLFRILEHPFLKKIGVFSYSLYLVHFPLHEGLVANIDLLANSKIVATVVTFALSMAIAWVIDVAVDTPLKKVRARLR